MLHTVVFTGRSGSGKGTQAALLKDRIARFDHAKRKILYVETGEHFRKFIRSKSFSSRLSREVYEEGARQPDFLASWMWSEILIAELGEDMHLVLDGTPRSLAEAVILSTAMRFYHRERPTVVFLNVSRRWSEDRLLSRGRSDDLALEKINKRLDWFDKEVLPALKYFRENSLYRFIEVNGEQPIEKVHADIVAAYDYGY